MFPLRRIASIAREPMWGCSLAFGVGTGSDIQDVKCTVARIVADLTRQKAHPTSIRRCYGIASQTVSNDVCVLKIHPRTSASADCCGW